MKNILPFAKLTSVFAIASLAIVSIVGAVEPPPDGGYPNQNTAEGEDALLNLTSGFFNTAIGYKALAGDTSGSLNTALGAQALLVNTTGTSNTAGGSQALLSNSTGARNTASGADALLQNNTGDDNTATGASALVLNLSGSGNTAVGRNALSNNSSGNDNISLGESAGSNLTTGSNNIDIGNSGVAGESNRIRIGTKGTQRATFIAGISGVTVPAGIPVLIDNNGRLGTTTSSARFKKHIDPMDNASEAILSLQPVTFRYKDDLDPAGIRQFGLVAEQVEKVNPDLVAHDEEGKPYTVRYEAVNAMLLNEFLKEHRKVEQLQATVAAQKSATAQQEVVNAEQQKEISALKAALNEQGAQIQKVSAEIAAVSAPGRLVTNE